MRDITQKLLDLAGKLKAVSDPAKYPSVIHVKAGPAPGWAILMLHAILAVEPVAKWLELHEPADTEERFRARFKNIKSNVHYMIQTKWTPEREEQRQTIVDKIAREAKLLTVYCRQQIRNLGDPWAVPDTPYPEPGKPTELHDATPISWTKPMPLKHWAKAFDKSENTISSWFQNGQVKARKVGRSWAVAEYELPADYEHGK
jgi:hypothetical protein